MPSPSASPSSTLTASGSENRFVLFTQDWLNLQNYISAGIALPISTGDFKTKYGDFPSGDQKLITDCVSAMKDVNGLSSSFGDPNKIKQKIASDPGYLGGLTPPDMLYGHMIWLASQIQNQASTFNFTLSSLKPLFTGTKAENAANLKEVLTGQGGLTSTAQTASTQVGDLLKSLMSFDTQFTDANNRLQTYTGSQSQVLAAANKAVTDLESLIKQVRDEADAAHKLWEDLTISAVTVSVGITILSAGLLLPLGAVAGTALGIAAAKALEAYNDLCGQLEKDEAKKTQKTQLVTDLTGLNGLMLTVAPAMNAFKTSLAQIEGVWVDINTNLLYIVNNYTVDQLGDLSWVMQAMKVLDAQKKWQGISDSAQLFVQGSLVTYTTKPFGQSIAA